MARVLIPVVVDHVDESALVHLWRSPGGVVNIVAFEGDLVVGACEIESPIVVSITRSTPAGLAVDLTVGYRDRSVCLVTCHDVHSADEGCGHMVDPDIRASVESYGIATPNVFWVELCDCDVLP